MTVDDPDEEAGQFKRVDVVQLAGLCRPPNYAERFWMRPIVCPNLWPVERASPKFHSA